MNPRTLLWIVLTVLYAGFFFWYTNTEGPLSDEEVQALLDRYSQNDEPATDLATLEHFMRSDTGNQFIMVNVLDLNENPTGVGEGKTAQELLDHYMEYMYPALFSRASHPIFVGQAVAPAMDLVGIEGAENWDSGALMRYRSRRDILEIANNPVFAERHDHKLAALTKTIAYPVEVQISLADPRFHLALILLIIGLILEKPMVKRTSEK